MDYEKPTLTPESDNVTPACAIGGAFMVAVAAIVWNVVGVYNYALAAVAAAAAAVAYQGVGTDC